MFWQYLSKSAISQLLLTRLWPNLKVSFLGPTLTDVDGLGDICPSNIWPRNICPYQQYLSCSCTNFSKVDFWGLVYQMPCVRGTFGPNYFGGLNLFGPKHFLIQLFFDQTFGGSIYFCTQSLLDPWIFNQIFGTQNGSGPIFFLLDQKYFFYPFRTQIFGPKFLGPYIFRSKVF